MFLRAYRYRFYPTKEQEVLLSKTFGCCRFVFNHFLKAKTISWKECGASLSYAGCCKLLTELKRNFPWLKEVSSVCLQQSLRHLLAAFENFFNKRARYPKYKTKLGRQGASFMQNAFQYKEGKVYIAKLGSLDVRWSRHFSGIPKSVTLSTDTTGRYYICFLVEEPIAPLAFVKKEIGLDVGLSQMLTDQEGNTIANPRFLEKSYKRQRRLQKALSRKVKGSNNRKQAKKLLASLHRRIKEKRLDFLHKVSKKVVDENQIIAVETLSVKKMQKSRLSRQIGDVGWSLFHRLLEYKSLWYGRSFVRVDKHFPSSKQCSNCGNVYDQLKLGDRHWRCTYCGEEHNRDKNAAQNILQEGLKKLSVPWGTRDLKPVELV